MDLLEDLTSMANEFSASHAKDTFLVSYSMVTRADDLSISELMAKGQTYYKEFKITLIGLVDINAKKPRAKPSFSLEIKIDNPKDASFKPRLLSVNGAVPINVANEIKKEVSAIVDKIVGEEFESKPTETGMEKLVNKITLDPKIYDVRKAKDQSDRQHTIIEIGVRKPHVVPKPKLRHFVKAIKDKYDTSISNIRMRDTSQDPESKDSLVIDVYIPKKSA